MDQTQLAVIPSPIKICPYCKAENRKSRLKCDRVNRYSQEGKVFDWYFFDEDGLYHHHDPSQIDIRMVCTNGHMFDVLYQKQCEVCEDDWQEIAPEIRKI